MTGPNNDVEWFERTGHCGGCGQPGRYCLCTPRNPCSCRHLHEMGSGRTAEALDTFVVSDEVDQEGLW